MPEQPKAAVEPNPVPVTETPEFKAAVAEALKQALPAALATIKEGMEHGAAAAPTAQDPHGMLSGLAMAIADLTDQGGQRKKLAPGEIARRENAKVRMERLIVEARQDRRPALYRLTEKLFLDEAIIDPMWLDASKKAQQTTIELDGVPNQTLVPLNDTATDIHAAFMESIGDTLIKPVETADPYITPMGLVINGQAPQRRDIGPRGSGHARIVRDGERVGGEFQAVRVLGTVAEPAQQTV